MRKGWLFLVLLILVNLYIFGQVGLLEKIFSPLTGEDTFNAGIAGFKARKISGKYSYDVKIKISGKQVREKGQLEILFEDGRKKDYEINLAEEEININFVDEKRVEFVSLALPDWLEDENPADNIWQENIWSPRMKIGETTIKPELKGIIDKDENLWLVYCDRKKDKPQIFVKVINKMGETIVEGKRLSTEGVYSVSPDIAIDKQGFIHIAFSTYQNDRDVVIYSRLKLFGTRLDVVEKKIFQLKGEKDALVNPSLYIKEDDLFLLVKEDKMEKVYNHYFLSSANFTVFKIENNKFFRVFSLPITEDSTYTKNVRLIFNRLYRDEDGNYYIIWGTKMTWGKGGLFFSKIDSSGKILVKNKLIKSLLMISDIDFSIQCKFVEDKYFHLAWVEQNNVHERKYEINHLVINLFGDSVNENRLAGPSDYLVNDVNLSLAGNGQLLFAWSDEEAGKPTANQDIVYSRVEHNRGLIPPIRLTFSRADEKAPQIYLNPRGVRYALWYQYGEDWSYELYLKTTNPELKGIMEEQFKWQGRLEKFASFMVAIFFSIASLLIFAVPFNILPVLGLIGYFQWITGAYTRSNILSWINFILVLIPLKLLNNILIRGNFVNLMRVGLEKMLLINLISLGVMFLLIIPCKIIYKKRNGSTMKFNADYQVLFITLWLLLDTISVLSLNLSYYI